MHPAHNTPRPKPDQTVYTYGGKISLPKLLCAPGHTSYIYRTPMDSERMQMRAPLTDAAHNPGQLAQQTTSAAKSTATGPLLGPPPGTPCGKNKKKKRLTTNSNVLPRMRAPVAPSRKTWEDAPRVFCSSSELPGQPPPGPSGRPVSLPLTPSCPSSASAARRPCGPAGRPRPATCSP